MPLKISVSLHCDECPSHEDFLLTVTSEGMAMPDGYSGDWQLDYQQGLWRSLENAQIRFKVTNPAGSGTEPPTVTCSDDCRKAIDTKKRLAADEILKPTEADTTNTVVISGRSYSRVPIKK